MKKFALAILFASVLALTAGAQTTGLTFSTASEGMGFHYKGQWAMANHTTESFDFLDWGAQKNNSLALEVHELINPQLGFNSYLAGVKVTPDLSGLLNRTNLPNGTFQFFAQAAVGETPVGASPQITSLFGGGAQYRLTANLAWSTVDVYYGRIGSNAFTTVSSGLMYVFNPQASPSAMVKALVRKSAVVHQ